MPATSWAINHLLHYDTLSFSSCPTHGRHEEQGVLITYLFTWMSKCSGRIYKWSRQVSYVPRQSTLQYTHTFSHKCIVVCPKLCEISYMYQTKKQTNKGISKWPNQIAIPHSKKKSTTPHFSFSETASKTAYSKCSAHTKDFRSTSWGLAHVQQQQGF